MSAKSLMIQGTSSHAGKSTLVTAFCRLFAQEGLRVAPFKSQNMSLNSFVTPKGEEIAIAQAVQAEAAGVEVEAEMNPILLKPTEDRKSQVILMGRPVQTMDVFSYDDYKKTAWDVVKRAYESLASRYDLIVIEGAGSPVEMNLKANDIANMKVAEMAGASVILVADIDRGGVIASLVGTMELLEPPERERVIGFIINKFRGERKLLDSAIEFIEKRTGKPVLGVIPHLGDLKILEEDGVSLEKMQSRHNQKGSIRIAVIRLRHISNFTDFMPLELEPEISLKYVTEPEELEDPHLVILPGTKSTIEDMDFLWKSGLARKILGLKDKTVILGICGGYQMLGREIRDPDHVESERESIRGLGLIDAVTVFEKEKRTVRVRAEALSEAAFFQKGQVYSGYEIHMGKTETLNGHEPLFRLVGSDHEDGAVALGGKVLGTYLHGLFENDFLRRSLIEYFIVGAGLETRPYHTIKTSEYDRLAQTVRENIKTPFLDAWSGFRYTSAPLKGD